MHYTVNPLTRVWVILVIAVPVPWSGVACAPWLAAAAGAAGHITPVAVGKRSGSRQGDAAGEEGGPGPRTQEAIILTVPKHLEQDTVRKRGEVRLCSF